MQYDLIIRNGTIIDGSGMARYRADLGIVGGQIATIGKIRDEAREEIDAEGHTWRPGLSTCTPTWTPRCSGTPSAPAHAGTGYLGRDGQLRLLAGALRGERQAAGDAQPGARRGYRARGDGGRDQVVVGNLPAIPRRGRPHPQGNQLRPLRGPFRAAHLRDGRAGVHRRGHPRRPGRDEARVARRDPRRRDRLHHLAHPQPSDPRRQSGRQPPGQLGGNAATGRRDGRP